MLKIMNLVLHVFLMDIGGTGIMLDIIRLGVTMEVLWSMIVMTILRNIVLNFR